MSEEDIKKLSEAFAEQEYNEVLPYLHNPSPKEKDEFVRKASGDIRKAFQWLAKDYCIVPKAEVVDWVNTLENFMPNTQSATMMKIGAKRLFGKELF